MNIDKLVKKKQHAKRDGNLLQLAEITKTLGDMYFENGESKKALKEYTEQLSVCEDLQDKLNCAIAHRMIGEVYTNLGKYEQALLHQNLYLEGAKEMKNLIEKQRALATLGRTYFCLAESLINQSWKRNEALANAEIAFVQSMELCDQLETEIKLEEKTLMRARLLLNLGLTLEAREQTQQTIDLMEKAILLCKSNNFQEDLHRTCISLASIYEQRSNHELALNYIEIAATVNDTRLKAEAKVVKAELFMRSGQWIEARKVLISLYQNNKLLKDINHQVEKYLKIIVTLCRVENNVLVETDTQAKQKLYETLGDAAVAVQCFDKGVEYYQHMLTCAEKTGNQIGIALISLARTLKDARRYKEALPFVQREFELCTSSQEKCRSALFLADLLRATDATNAKIREYYTLALNSANSSDNVKLQKSVLKEFVSYLESIDQFDEANNAKQEAGLTSEILSNTESEASSEESDEIGTDICLEDLSDLEAEENIKETNVTKRRAKKAPAIKRNEKGETQLHVACINNNISGVETFLSSGHPTNVRDHCGWTPLHEAANHGYIDVAELLLKHGANVNDPGSLSCKGMTPLHDAACNGHFSMMQLLMQHGANVALKTHDGDTVLDCLEDWRDRVEDLSPEDLVEYDIMHRKLSAVILVRKKRRSDNTQILDEKSVQSESQKISAGEDYKRTIANLRSFNKTNTAALFKSSKNTVTPLVNEEQILIDDWLEDDIRSTTKKKFTSNNYVTTTKRKFIDENIQSTSKKLRVNDTFQNEDFGMSEDSSDDNAAEIIQLLEKPQRTKRKRQMSLTLSEFTISRTLSPVHLESSTISSKHHDKEYVCLPIFVKEKTFDLKIEICEDEKEFLRSITTVTEHLFNNETGCIVKLQLQPINGNIATKENVLKIARESTDDKKLECEVVELRIPPIVERYKTICYTHDFTPCENILKCLKTCENTGIFRVKSDDVNKDQLVSLLKTLEYERNLKLLELSGILLLTAGTHLHQCLSNILFLQELYLKGCDINFTCLREINSLPPQLKVLDLSYNPLGSDSRDVLRKLIAPLRHLQTLNLRYCKLENFHFPLDNPNLTNCNISWNKLSRDAITSFLSRTMFDLNLSNVLSSNRFILNLNTMSMILSPSIESLELSFCDITDSDVKVILAQLPRLLKLILIGNTNVSVLSVNRLLSRQPTLTYIDVSGCKNIMSGPEAQLIIQNPEVCTLLANMPPDLCESWIKLWRGAGVVTKLPYNLAIFKPI
ncbi:tonsoku-like protein [Linepithema humile]|uniref:tonsoku-like protein n=1 Tax=Linepithema humile TaxID=83485 RepID=UPI0006236732|nr:PREDICTED: tonsoku-like protein [Linepithema humile]